MGFFSSLANGVSSFGQAVAPLLGAAIEMSPIGQAIGTVNDVATAVSGKPLVDVNNFQPSPVTSSGRDDSSSYPTPPPVVESKAVPPAQSLPPIIQKATQARKITPVAAPPMVTTALPSMVRALRPDLAAQYDTFIRSNYGTHKQALPAEADSSRRSRKSSSIDTIVEGKLLKKAPKRKTNSRRKPESESSTTGSRRRRRRGRGGK